MQVTHELVREHQLFVKYLDLMERYIDFSKTDRHDNLLLNKAQDFLSFFQVFADNYHHAKEEDILFKYLQAPGVLTHCNPVSVMLHEHKQGRAYVQNMKDAAEQEELGSLCENAMNFSQLLKQHIFKEDNVLYPMAENGLSDDDKAAVSNEYQQIEDKLNKLGIWEEYENTYSELENCLNSKIN